MFGILGYTPGPSAVQVTPREARLAMEEVVAAVELDESPKLTDALTTLESVVDSLEPKTTTLPASYWLQRRYGADYSTRMVERNIKDYWQR